ncbi:MAG: hypothetical protein ABSG03_04985 [Bryobacteraceae bacterium]|jgi:hypothetical protein
MTDAQLLTLAIAIIVPLSLLLYSNSRITDTKETLRAEIGETKQTLRAEIGETKQTLRAEMEALRAETAAGFVRIERAIERLETKLVIHELEHHK